MENVYLYVGLGAILAIIIAVIMGKKFKAKLSTRGLEIESDNSEKTRTNVENIKNKSKIDVDSPDNRDIHIKDVDDSEVKIKK